MPRKLAPKFIGPFKILQKRSPLVYKLELLAHFKVHPIFHISQLKSYNKDINFG